MGGGGQACTPLQATRLIWRSTMADIVQSRPAGHLQIKMPARLK